MKRVIIFLFVFLSYRLEIVCQIEDMSRYNILITIPDRVIMRFVSSDRKQIQELINRNLISAANIAITTFLRNRGNIKDGNIQVAIDQFIFNITNMFVDWEGSNGRIIRLILPSSQRLDITYDWDTDYYNHYGNNLTSQQFIPGGDIDLHGDSSQTAYDIAVYNAIQDCQIPLFSASFERCDGKLLYKHIYLQNNILPPSPSVNNTPIVWTNSGNIRLEIAAVIFHEMVHIALHQCANPILQSRASDDATVEDIALKIFPSNNIYEIQYLTQAFDFVVYRNPLAFLYSHNDSSFRSRYFNPPQDLKYKRGGGIFLFDKGAYFFNGNTRNRIFTQILYTHTDDTNCDDARSEQLFNYAIPYRCCRNRNCPRR